MRDPGVSHIRTRGLSLFPFRRRRERTDRRRSVDESFARPSGILLISVPSTLRPSGDRAEDKERRRRGI